MQSQQQVDGILRRVYELYTDYVLKNPFYGLENPVRVEEWERRLGREMGEWNHK